MHLHRDASTGQEQVFLKAPIFGEPWQNEVAAAGASTVRGFLGAQPSRERLIALTHKVMASTSQLAEGFLARAPAGTVACKAGCDHCCYQSVGVTPPEAIAIFEFVKQTRTGAAFEAFAAHVAERYTQTRGLSSSERFSPQHPCVFLESGRCSIYEVRPLSCRGMNSLNAEECATRLRDPEARAAFLLNGAGSHSFLEPIRAFHALSAGLQLGLAELYALDVRPLDLIAAMQLLLRDSESVVRDWMSGAPAFESTLGSDSSGSAAIRRLSGALSADE
ncbi:MAG TPA: YkgJ family cysteine cluster protein [Polyangiaceae bacterium]|nr:YkgJ family cysteine cluster protein [Polyangiaceae bacterium]